MVDEPACHVTEQGEKTFTNIYHELKVDSSRDRLEEALEGHHVKILGQGDHRWVVYDHDGAYIGADVMCVVKLAKYGDTTHNENEVENYQKVNDRLKRYLNPPTEYHDDYGWVVFPYLEGEPTDKQMFQMQRAFIEEGWDTDDVRKDNCAVIDGHAIMIDYGFEFEPIDFDVMDMDERINLKKWRWGV